MGSISGVALLCAVCLAQSLISQAQNSEQEDFIDLHNAIRDEVGVGTFLKWNSTLEAYAQNYANKRAEDCALIHSNGPYGENIYWGKGEGWDDVAAAMRVWYEEKEDYDYKTNTCAPGKECLHFTQIVWKNSEQIGCATATCKNQATFFACNYYPMGNIIGEKPY